jgi:hypothetical protein
MKKSLLKKISMSLIFALLLASLFVSAVGAYGPLTMFTPASGSPSPGSLYPRALQLHYGGNSNGYMLATFEKYVSGTPTFPIYRSQDSGASWTKISDVTDTKNGWGMRYQPFLYELPQTIGSMGAGVVLAVGNSIPSDLSKTKLDVYKSVDHGQSWSYVSSIATGGKADPNGTQDPIWEPFVMVANNKLIVYYSDERDPANNQKIVHQTSSDGINWSSVVNDVALGTTLRPGMPTIAKMGNGSYLMAYEIVGYSGGNQTRYKVSTNPESWNPSNAGTELNGTAVGGSPYVIWMSSGGTNGTLVLSANNSDNLYINKSNGTGTWSTISSPVNRAYSRSLVTMADNKTAFIISTKSVNGLNNVIYGNRAIN